MGSIKYGSTYSRKCWPMAAMTMSKVSAAISFSTEVSDITLKSLPSLFDSVTSSSILIAEVAESPVLEARKASDQLEELAMGKSEFEKYSPESNYLRLCVSDILVSKRPRQDAEVEVALPQACVIRLDAIEGLRIASANYGRNVSFPIASATVQDIHITVPLSFPSPDKFGSASACPSSVLRKEVGMFDT